MKKSAANPTQDLGVLQDEVGSAAFKNELVDVSSHLLDIEAEEFWAEELWLIWTTIEGRNCAVYPSAFPYGKYIGKNHSDYIQERVEFFNNIKGMELIDTQQEPAMLNTTDSTDDAQRLTRKQYTLLTDNLKVALNALKMGPFCRNPDHDVLSRWASVEAPVSEALRAVLKSSKHTELEFTTQFVMRSDVFSFDSKAYVVFNERTQLFDLVTGVPIGHVLKLEKSALEKLFQRAGGSSRALKLRMVEHDLSVLDDLVNHGLRQGYRRGTRYVEWGVSWEDFTRPWVARRLMKPELQQDTLLFTDGLSESLQAPMTPAGEANVTADLAGVAKRMSFKYVALFDRCLVRLPFERGWRCPDSTTDEAAAFLADNNASVARLACDVVAAPEMYAAYVAAAADMDAAFTQCPHLLEKVVGIGMEGNLYGYPFSPFWMRTFIDFCEERITQQSVLGDTSGGSSFGLALDDGNVSRAVYEKLAPVTSAGSRAYEAHMAVVNSVLTRVASKRHDAVSDGTWGKGRSRIAVGVGAQELLAATAAARKSVTAQFKSKEAQGSESGAAAAEEARGVKGTPAAAGRGGVRARGGTPVPGSGSPTLRSPARKHRKGGKGRRGAHSKKQQLTEPEAILRDLTSLLWDESTVLYMATLQPLPQELVRLAALQHPLQPDYSMMEESRELEEEAAAQSTEQGVATLKLYTSECQRFPKRRKPCLVAGNVQSVMSRQPYVIDKYSGFVGGVVVKFEKSRKQQISVLRELLECNSRCEGFSIAKRKSNEQP